MNVSAIVMMVVALTVLLGGFSTCVIIEMRHGKKTSIVEPTTEPEPNDL